MRLALGLSFGLVGIYDLRYHKLHTMIYFFFFWLTLVGDI